MFNPTKQQKDAITTRGSVLVTAAAGSGKTAVLVERVIGMLCDRENPSSIDRLLIVTFTNAAAAEMRQRIEKRLYEELAKNPTDSRLARQILLLPSANICTIDTFCINLVRENFGHFSISPDFKIVDSAELMPLYDSAVNEVLSEYYENETERITSLLEALNCTYGDSRLAEAVFTVFEYSRHLPFPEHWLRRCKYMYQNAPQTLDALWRGSSLADAKKELKTAKKRLFEALDAIDGNQKLADSYKNTLVSAYELCEKICACLETDRNEALLLCKSVRMPPVYGHNGDPIASGVRYARSSFISAAESFCKSMIADDETVLQELEMAAPHVITLIEIIERFSSRLFSLMCEKNMLTFYNTEQMALELLCSTTESGYVMSDKAVELSDSFEEILVDEYQDTNDLQDTLFYLLSDCGKKLFSVGDVKQSIYGFRGANPENFVNKKDTYIPLSQAGDMDKKKIVLSSNFRSRCGICGFVNFFFSLLMSKQFGGVDYDEEEVLNSAASFPPVSAPDTEMHIVNASDSEDSIETAEAKHIAAYIKNAVNEAPFLRDGDKLRKATYRDFAILLRSPGGHSDVYMEELKKAGIPARFDTGGFISSREVSAVLSLLKVINNPTHDVPLLSVMMSPIFGFSADEMAEIRLCSRESSLYSAVVTSAKQGNAHAQLLLSELARYRRTAVTMSVEQLITWLYDETGLLDSVCMLDEGERRRSNLLLLADYARGYSEGGGDIRGFIAYMEKIGRSVKTGAGVGGDNAVTIVSFHGSKGLQYPVCIIAGCFRRFNRSDSTASLVTDSVLGVAFKVADPKGNRFINTVAREAIAASVARRNISEELRVMYVALTRAEERLVVLLSGSDPIKRASNIAKKITSSSKDEILTGAIGYLDWFMYALLRNADCAQLRELAQAALPEEMLVSAPDCKIKLVIGAPDEVVAEADVNMDEKDESVDKSELISRLNFEYPHKALSNVVAKTSVSDIVHSENPHTAEFSERPAFLSKAGLTPAQRGTATHRFMQFADYTAAAENIENELCRLTEREFITKAEADAIDKKQLQRFFESELFARMTRCEQLHRERRFMSEVSVKEIYGIDTPDNEKTVVQGVVDCVIEEENSIVVLDFKTDRVGSTDELVERYAAQLEIYSQACEKMYSKPVSERIIYSFALSKAIKL